MELAELCKELNNYFNCDKYRDGIPGKYVIDHGILDLSELITKGALQDGQFFRLSGSVFNDDVYQFSTSTPNDMTDETFEGILWPMSVPREVTSLLSDINLWISKYGTDDGHASSPFQSESFGGYSYSKGAGNSSSTGDNADVGTWQNAFRSRLNKWRKMRP